MDNGKQQQTWRRNYSQSEGGAGRAITASGAVSGGQSSQRRAPRPPLPFLPSLSLRRRQSARQIIIISTNILPWRILTAGLPTTKLTNPILLERFLFSALPFPTATLPPPAHCSASPFLRSAIVVFLPPSPPVPVLSRLVSCHRRLTF
jgi:hypothetical protein